MFKNAQILVPATGASTSVDPDPEFLVAALNAEFHPFCGIIDFVQKPPRDVAHLTDDDVVEIRAAMLSLLLQKPGADPCWSDLIAWVRAMRTNSYLMSAHILGAEFKQDLESFSNANPWLLGLIFAVVDTDPDAPEQAVEAVVNEIRSIPIPVLPQSAWNKCTEDVGRARKEKTEPEFRREIQVHFAPGQEANWTEFRDKFAGLETSACLFAVPKLFDSDVQTGWLSRKLILGLARTGDRPAMHLYLHDGDEQGESLKELFNQPPGARVELLSTLLAEGTSFCIGLRHKRIEDLHIEVLRTEIMNSLNHNGLIFDDDPRELWITRLSLRRASPEKVEYYLVQMVQTDDREQQSSSTFLRGVRQ